MLRRWVFLPWRREPPVLQPVLIEASADRVARCCRAAPGGARTRNYCHYYHDYYHYHHHYNDISLMGLNLYGAHVLQTAS